MGIAAPAFSPGDVVDIFQIVRLLGRGGAGDVWLARDQLLGRKVALKVLRATDEGRTLNVLLDEARATAKVVHPHVVTVYAVGSHRGAPWLALEYIDGVTLRQRMLERAPTVPEALRLAKDIAAAVAAAHATGVLHLDLKPDNVLLAVDGRLRVVDFGLARLRRRDDEDDSDDDRAGMSIAGTPAYMAPEIWRGETPTEAADAWAFGVLLCELLTLRQPYPQETIPQLVAALFSPQEAPLPPLPEGTDPEVRALLARLLHKDPTRRPAMADVARFLEQVVARPHGAPLDENPFRGLDAFREADASRYFGRDDEIEAFVALMERAPFLPVVGHSGAGKSSFVRAGVVPRLRERGPWIVVSLRPGPRPFIALARALRQAQAPRATRPEDFPLIEPTEDALSPADITETGSAPRASPSSSPQASRTLMTRSEITEPVRALADTLAAAPERLHLELTRLARDGGARVLLFVDQLEEVQTLVRDAGTANAFLRALAAAGDDVDEPVRVVVTLRDDFLGRLAAVDELRGAFARVTVLRRPTLASLVESTVGPLLGTGVTFDDGDLPLEMARAVENEPAALPLLSFTCALLWERRDIEKKRLLRRVYVELGGVVGALATHADAVLDGMPPQAQRQARLVLLGLVTSERTRRRRSRRELIAECGGDDPQGAAAVIDRLVEARLLTSERSAREDDSEVELAHEALVKTWGRLLRFLDEERDQLDFVQEVQQAAEVWARRGRRSSEVWTGAALQDALARVKRATLPLPPTARAFLDEGQREQRRRTRQRSALVGAAFVALIVVALVLLVARNDAIAAATVATQARAVAEREAADAALARGDVWSARAKARTALELDDSVEGRALWRRIEAGALLFSTRLSGPVMQGGFAPDGTVWVIHVDDRLVGLDGRTFLQRDFPVLRDQRLSLWTLAVLGDHALVGVRDVGRVALVDLLHGASRVFDLHDSSITDIVAVQGRGLFVTAGRDGRVRAVTRDGTPRDLFFHATTIRSLAVAADERSVFAIGDDASLLSIPLDGSESPAPRPLDGDARDLAVLPDGRVVIGFSDGRMIVGGADGPAGGPLRIDASAFVGDTGVAQVAADPRGQRVAVHTGNGAIVLWGIVAGDGAARGALRPVAWLEPSGAGAVGAIAFDPSGERLLSTNRDGDVRVWQVDARHLSLRQEPTAPYLDVAISDDGQRVAEVADEGVVLRSTATGEALGFVPIVGDVNGLALDREGRSVAFGVDQRAFVRAIDSRDGGRVLPLDGTTMTDAVWIDDDTLVIVTRGGGVLRFEGDAAQPAVRTKLPSPAVSVEQSPDGRFILVAGREGKAFLLDTATLAEVRRFSVAQGAAVSGVAFSPDGARVAFATVDVVEVRGIDGALVRRIAGEHIAGTCVGFARDGRVLSLRVDGPVLIDVDTGAETPLFHVSPSGSCEGTGGLVAMRLGDYVLPIDIDRDAPLWFTRGFVGDVPSTHRSTTYPPGSEPGITSVAQGPRHLCLTESGGRFTWVDGARHEVVARAVDTAAWPVVVASHDGCVWQHGTELRRLRPEPEREGVVDVIARDVVGFGGEEGIVVAMSSTGLRVVLDGARAADLPLPLGDELRADGSGALTVRGRELALAVPSGWVAMWDLDHPGPPRLVRMSSGDVTSVAIGPGGLLATGTSGETMAVIDRSTGAVVIDERVRGAVTHLRFVQDGADVVLLVGTNLGLVHRFDVTPMVAERCALLQRVWSVAPVSWEQGRATPTPPPADHPCAPR